MKNLLFILPFLFLFFQYIDGQTEPRLVKKITQIYSDSLDQYFHGGEENYEYDARGNHIFQEGNIKDIDGAITSWVGTKYEYDSQDRLVKETRQRYNWELGLWLTQMWIEYSYDNDGCIKERFFQQNLANREASVEKVFSSDELCRETEIHTYQFMDDTLTKTNIVELEFDDIERSRLESFYFVSSGAASLFYQNKIVYNEHQDIIEWITKIDWSGGNSELETIDSSLATIDYIYNSQTERLEHKKIERLNFSYDNNQQEILEVIYVSEIAYQYSCDGLLVQEEQDHLFTSVTNTTDSHHRFRYHYIYEGEDECFDASTHQDMVIFPNPASEQIQIESTFLTSGNTLIEVIDMNGRILLSNVVASRNEKTALGIGQLPNGIYTVRVSNDEYFLSKKLVVVK